MLKKLMKKKFYLKDAIIVLPWLTVAYLLRTVNVLTSQVTELQEMFTRQTLELTLLKEEYNTINETSIELKKMIQIKEQNGTANTADLIIAQNEMTQFYLNYIGIALLAGVALYTVGTLISPASFTLQALIPARLFSLIQDNTPFCQTMETFTHYDSQHRITWLVNLYNGKRPDVFIKPENAGDFERASLYIARLMGDAGTIVPYNNMPPGARAVVAAADMGADAADLVAISMGFV